MKTTSLRWVTGAFAAALLVAAAGCIATGGYYDDSYGASYGVGYYEPYGHVYGHWPSNYRVAPPRRDRDRDVRPQTTHPVSRPRPPAYRPAPPTRKLPTLPPQPRRHDR